VYVQKYRHWDLAQVEGKGTAAKKGEANGTRIAVAVLSGAQSRRQEFKIYDTYITYITSIFVSYK
jgi:hypothetical protein